MKAHDTFAAEFRDYIVDYACPPLVSHSDLGH
jgi:hypothetical protein